ncbi:unnamed protein product [Peronospora farinosa]|uniref:Uncharacterized protein n=1 Tax=Peronospora farinosa TaxID=134698 RepID=A0ABN8C3X0_9STRA|nr:unnamed protein product [Peronospora farinosa]
MTTIGLSDEEDDSEEGRKMHRDSVSKLHFAERQRSENSQEDATDKWAEGFEVRRGLLEFANGKGVLPESMDGLTKRRGTFSEAKATERRMLPKEAAAKERDCHAQFEKECVLRMHGADADDIDKEKAEGDAEDGDDNEELDESEEGESEAESVKSLYIKRQAENGRSTERGDKGPKRQLNGKAKAVARS